MPGVGGQIECFRCRSSQATAPKVEHEVSTPGDQSEPGMDLVRWGSVGCGMDSDSGTGVAALAAAERG
jgi:hypothetical protein